MNINSSHNVLFMDYQILSLSTREQGGGKGCLDWSGVKARNFIWFTFCILASESLVHTCHKLINWIGDFYL